MLRQFRGLYLPRTALWCNSCVCLSRLSPKCRPTHQDAQEIAALRCEPASTVDEQRRPLSDSTTKLISLNQSDSSKTSDILPPCSALPGSAMELKTPQQLWQPRNGSLQLRERLSLYAKLSKARLSAMVVMTAAGGYFMAPDPFVLSSLALCCAGTLAFSASANTFNQYLEMPFDAQMKRTQNRVLVCGQLSPLHGFGFALTSGLVGFSVLLFGVNGLTALLGLLNCVLYSAIYTPLKRISIANTWVGSAVGAIPPLMGWSACCGTLGPGAFVIAGLLYSWQFPHFNALSWNLRSDYSRAGYRMASVTHPELCKRVALRHSVISLLLCSFAAPMTQLTTWLFAATSLPLNACLVYFAWRFYKQADSQSARKLFRFSILYLPVVMLLMLLTRDYSSKNGQNSSISEADTTVLQ